MSSGALPSGSQCWASQESGPGLGDVVVVEVVDAVDEVPEVVAVDVVVSSVIVVEDTLVVVVDAVEVDVAVVVVTPQENSSGFSGFHLPSSLHQMRPWASPSQ